MRLLIAAALIAAFSAPAYAQILNDAKPKTYRSDAAKQDDADLDRQYRARRNSKGDDAPKADPWSGVRSTTPATTAAPAKKPAN